MRYFSACSGIASASVAWAALAWTPIAFAEIESFACVAVIRRVDGSRYRAIDNAIACNVMRWIGRRIEMVEGLL